MAQLLSPFIAALRAETDSLSEKFIASASEILIIANKSVIETWLPIFTDVTTGLADWMEDSGKHCLETPDIFRGKREEEYTDVLSVEIVRKAMDARVRFESFARMLKVMRMKYVDFMGTLAPEIEQLLVVRCIHTFCDTLEIAAFAKWHKNEKEHHKRRLYKARKTVLQEKKRYLTIFQRISEPAFVVDSNLCLVEANISLENFFGIPTEDLRGRKCCEILAKNGCRSCVIKEAFHKQTSFSSSEEILTVNNDKKTVILSGTFLGEIAENMSGSIVIIQDLTEKKRVEQALQESEEKYRTLVENVPDVTWRVDQTGSLIFISPNIKKLTGYSPEEFSSWGPRGRAERIHPSDVARVKKEFNQLFFSSKKFDIKYRFRKKDGSWIWLHDRAGVIYLRDGVWMADGVVSDVTELMRIQEELEEYRDWLEDMVDERTHELKLSNAQLRREIAERQLAEQGLMDLAINLKRSNTELEQFAHVASHDLKEPLMLIVAFSERLRNRYGAAIGERGREYLSRILKAASKMQQLVDGLLQLSRVTTAARSFETIDLNELLDEVILDLEETINMVQGQINIASLHTLNGDKLQMRQLLHNIIKNSLKYHKKMECPHVQIKSRLLSGGVCEITVTDNGIGFEDRYVERIFQPFERLDNAAEYEGTGIGLATCKKIVMRHGGEITAKSSPGQGATFIIRLPLSQRIVSRDEIDMSDQK